jgi:predicted PurR-regulated permease PerM
VREAGARSWDALAGFLRGQTIVAAFDAVFIGLALWILGVPLVLPLAVLTFFGAYVPVIGATVAGLAAALVALFAEGPVTALLVIAAILVVQQLEGSILQPYVVGRSADVHPLAICSA